MRLISKLCAVSAVLVLSSCSDEEPSMMKNGATVMGVAGAVGTPAAGNPGMTPGAAGMAVGSAGMTAPPATAAGGGGNTGAAGGAAGNDPPAAGGPAAGGGAGMMPMAGGGAPMGGGGAPTIPPVSGPEDGDPSKPMVSIPNVTCGAPNITFAGVPASNMIQIGGRDVALTYPCAREGASVTFFLFIHGTLGEGQKIPFTMTNFPIHKHTDSHNFIIATPQAVGMQWTTQADTDHLYEVIDWVYATFGEKFNIRTMWASGGSAGAFKLSSFACDPKVAPRLNGVRMVVGGGCPTCSSKLACIVAQQEGELAGMEAMGTEEQKQMWIMRSNVERYAMMHGCGPREGPTSIGPVRAWTWPNCMKGFVHSYYLGAGEHADRWDNPMSVMHMVEELKAIEK